MYAWPLHCLFLYAEPVLQLQALPLFQTVQSWFNAFIKKKGPYHVRVSSNTKLHLQRRRSERLKVPCEAIIPISLCASAPKMIKESEWMQEVINLSWGTGTAESFSTRIMLQYIIILKNKWQSESHHKKRRDRKQFLNGDHLIVRTIRQKVS